MILHPLISENPKTIIQSTTLLLVVCILTVGGCTIHDNISKPERTIEEVKVLLAEQVTQQLDLNLQHKTLSIEYTSDVKRLDIQTSAIAKLVAGGVNPVAARCAILGARNTRDKTCQQVGLVIGNTQQKSQGG